MLSRRTAPHRSAGNGRIRSRDQVRHSPSGNRRARRSAASDYGFRLASGCRRRDDREGAIRVPPVPPPQPADPEPAAVFHADGIRLNVLRATFRWAIFASCCACADKSAHHNVPFLAGSKAPPVVDPESFGEPLSVDGPRAPFSLEVLRRFVANTDAGRYSAWTKIIRTLRIARTSSVKTPRKIAGGDHD